MGLPVLKASQIQVTQCGHQAFPLRVHATSITTIFQIMLWGPGAPECTNGLKNSSGTCTVLSSGFAPHRAIGNHVPHREVRALCRCVGGAQAGGWGVYRNDGVVPRNYSRASLE